MATIIVTPPTDAYKEDKFESSKPENGDGLFLKPFDENRSNSIFRRASCVVKRARTQSVVIVINFWTSFRGIFFAMTSSLIFSFSSLIVKHLTGIDPSMLALIRFGELAILSTVSLRGTDLNSLIGPPGSRLFVLFRGLTGASALYLRYIAVHMLPLGNIAVIKLSTPAFVAILARIFLKESCNMVKMVSFFLIMTGILFTIKIDAIFGTSLENQPVSSEDQSRLLLGAAFGLSAGLIASGTTILLRKLKHVHHSVTILNISLVGMIEMSLIAVSTDKLYLPECGYHPWLMMCLGVFSYFAQVLGKKALQYEEAAVVSMVKSACNLILAFTYQIVLFKQIPDRYTIIGTCLVTMAVILTTFQKFVKSRPADHKLRRLFRLLL